MNDLKPHIRLDRIPNNPNRQKRSGFGQVPDRDNISHGKKLRDDIDKIRRRHEDGEKDTDIPPAIRPVLVLKVDAENLLSEDELARNNMVLLDENEENRIYVFVKDNLEEVTKRADKYSEEVSTTKKNPTYNSFFSNINSIEEVSVKDRLSSRVDSANIKPDETYTFDLRFWYFESSEERADVLRLLQEFVESSNGSILDTYDRYMILMARIRIRGEFTDRLFQDNNIQLIDFPPQPNLGLAEDLELSTSDFQETTKPADDAPSLCVIDSGVVANHPFLGPAVGDTISVPSSMGAGSIHPHGTFVAGIALYGDLQECIDKRKFAPSLNIFSARVLNHNNRFDDDKLIVTQMEEAIRYFAEQYKCRVFNISIGDDAKIYSDRDKQYAWAHVLDALVRELDIIVVVSAGNVSLGRFYNDKAADIFRKHPHYLLEGIDEENDTRIIDPATAANVITVGALSNRKDFNTRYPNDVNFQPIAKELDIPSPFTRIGPGVNGAIKPEVCEDGGNMFWDGFSIRHHQELGIISLNSKFIGDRLFSTDIGTSFAAPKVAHLAARIIGEYPAATSSLVRALIANSSSIPSAIENLFDKKKSETQDSILKLCGYGKPNLDNALFSTNYRVTLIAEEEAELDTIQLYQIPIPQEFQQAQGERKIIISLAYNAPVRFARRDYIGVKMDFKLFRGVTANDLVNWYADKDSVDPTSETKRTANKECNLKPTTTRRSKGTLQKGVWSTNRKDQFEKYIDPQDDSFYLVITCAASAGMTKEITPKQPYALVVTLEHSDETINLYNLVQQQVTSRARVRIR